MKNCILSNMFLKPKQRFQPPSDSGEICNHFKKSFFADVDVNVDVWSEILLKVDPYSIFKCILVSKEWLKVITTSYFRRKYLKKWKGCFPVIGFISGNDYHSVGLGAASKLGSHIEKTKLQKYYHYFISKSSSGDGLLLCYDRECTLYVYNLNTTSNGDVTVTQLPPPSFAFPMIFEIISSYHDDASFKVITAECQWKEGKTQKIETFCSSRWMWEASELSCNDNFQLAGFTGVGSSSKGVVYWSARTVDFVEKLVAYDTNNPQKEGCIRLFTGPVNTSWSSIITYDIVYPQGSLHCATMRDDRIIRIWGLSEEDYQWQELYTMDIGCGWNMNAPTVTIKCHQFHFVSFVPGRSDSIFVARGYNLFIYHVDTKVVERYEGLVYKSDPTRFTTYKHFVPLTIAESGVWPSSPFSNGSNRSLRDTSRTSFKRLFTSLICH